jgi:hypothetical protein
MHHDYNFREGEYNAKEYCFPIYWYLALCYHWLSFHLYHQFPEVQGLSMGTALSWNNADELVCNAHHSTIINQV